MTPQFVAHLAPGAPGLISICRSLERQGMKYETVIERRSARSLANAPSVMVQLTIRGISAPRRGKVRALKTAPKVEAPKQTQAQRERELTLAIKHLSHCRERLKENLKGRHAPESLRSYARQGESLETIAKHRKIGRAVARIIARHRTRDPWQITKQDYADLDQALGARVIRVSQLDTRGRDRGYLPTIIKNYACGYYCVDKARPEAPEARENLGFVGCAPFYAPGESEYNPIQNFILACADVEYWQELVRLGREREGKQGVLIQ
jgi:hypothetical protein